jgi:hypothetical protein
MAENMIERVAKAMAESAGFCWENCAQSQWCRDARAGIAAMREPTEAMQFEGAKIGGQECSLLDATCIWQAMIDAALDHKQTGERE